MCVNSRNRKRVVRILDHRQGSKGIVKLYLSKLRGKDKNLKIFGTENDGKIILNYIPSKLIYEEEAIIYKILIIII